MSDVMCFFHPNTKASTTCTKCHKPICLRCTRKLTRGNAQGGLVTDAYCPECHKKTSTMMKVGFVIVAFIVIIAFAFILLQFQNF